MDNATIKIKQRDNAVVTMSKVMLNDLSGQISAVIDRRGG
jgi:hypothetical protein